MMAHVLVALDGSAHSRKALDFACVLARTNDARLTLLHVAQALHQDRTLVLGGAAITVHTPAVELERAGRKVIDAARDIAMSGGCADVECVVLPGGEPARRIVETAEERGVDTLVVGSRGLGDLSGLLLGSVSHKVNQLAGCTCVTVR